MRTYSAARPVLLMTAYSPENQGGGAVIVRSLIGEHGRPEVVWATLSRREGEPLGRVAYRRSARNPWLLPPAQLARIIDAAAERHRASAIWIVAHGPVLAAVAPLVEQFGRSVHLSVHDDPAWSDVFRTRRELPLTPWVRHSMASALAAAHSVDVISSGMRADFARRFGVNATLVRRVLDNPITPNKTYDRDGGGLSVGILGNLYAGRQLDVLMEAVAGASSEAGVRGSIVVIGRAHPDFVRRAAAVPGVEVTFTGHLPETEGIALLRRAFALYLGYPFGPRSAVFRRTSFPTKIATYLQASRPILVHAPCNSTLTPLLEVAPFTIPWFTTTAEAGARELLRAWRDGSMHRSQHDPAEMLREQYFGPSNRVRLFDALDGLPRAST